MVIDTKCQTIKKNNPTDEQVKRLYYGDEDDRRFLQRVLANDEIIGYECGEVKQDVFFG